MIAANGRLRHFSARAYAVMTGTKYEEPEVLAAPTAGDRQDDGDRTA